MLANFKGVDLSDVKGLVKTSRYFGGSITPVAVEHCEYILRLGYRPLWCWFARSEEGGGVRLYYQSNPRTVWVGCLNDGGIKLTEWTYGKMVYETVLLGGFSDWLVRTERSLATLNRGK